MKLQKEIITTFRQEYNSKFTPSSPTLPAAVVAAFGVWAGLIGVTYSIAEMVNGLTLMD